MDKSEFIKAMGSHLDLLYQAVETGFMTYKVKYRDFADAHNPRSRASLIHDHMVEAAKQVLPSPDFRFLPRQRNFFSFRDLCLIQLKKLRGDLLPSNYPTDAAQLFNDLGEVASLPGILADLPLITVGYLPNNLWTDIEGVFAARIKGGKLAWHHRLDAVPAGVVLSHPEFVTPPISFRHVHSTPENVQETTKRKRVKRRRSKKLPGSSGAEAN